VNRRAAASDRTAGLVVAGLRFGRFAERERGEDGRPSLE
jgi:hypothetical protein